MKYLTKYIELEFFSLTTLIVVHNTCTIPKFWNKYIKQIINSQQLLHVSYLTLINNYCTKMERNITCRFGSVLCVVYDLLTEFQSIVIQNTDGGGLSNFIPSRCIYL